MRRWLVLLLLAGGCPGEGTQEGGVCDDLCEELVRECGYEAFPTIESCEQGCAWNRSEGADVDGQLDCVRDAACNTFDIVECEHAYGIDD